MSELLRARKLKRVIIREEYVALTGDYKKAVILHQLEWLQSQAFDVDKYIAEEGARIAREGIKANILPTNGWFRKKADALSQETLLKLSDSNIHAHLQCFINRGWLQERTNPNDKRDRTKQYRLDLVRLKSDLEAIGYQLEGWAFDIARDELAALTSKTENAISKTENAICEIENEVSEIEDAISKTEIPFSKTEEHYKTQRKHLPQHTHITPPPLGRANNISTVCVNSKFSSEECRAYAESLRADGITNPGGYATKIHRTGEADRLIERFLQPAEKKPEVVSKQSCPDCHGTGFWYPAGMTKGVARCKHLKLPAVSIGNGSDDSGSSGANDGGGGTPGYAV